MKKKLLVPVLALAMALGTGTAFAADDPYDGKLDKPLKVVKTYEVNNGTAPAEDFNFKFEFQSYEGDFDGTRPSDEFTATIPFDAISADTVKDVALPFTASQFDLGVYTYKVTEVAPSVLTQGVTYSDENLYLVLTIVRDEENGKHYVAAMHYETLTGDKSKGFTNIYDAGTLAVTKQIEGNSADMDKKFEFKVTFAAQNNAHAFLSAIGTDAATTNREYTVSEDGLTFTFVLGDDETATFSNIPAGATYTVTEVSDGYTSSAPDGLQGAVDADENESVTITNVKNNTVDTGVILDSMPFVAVIAVVAGAAVAFVALKRRNAQF